MHVKSQNKLAERDWVPLRMAESVDESGDGESLVSRSSLKEKLSKHFQSSKQCSDDVNPVLRLLELEKYEPRRKFGKKYSVVKKTVEDDAVSETFENSARVQDDPKAWDKSSNYYKPPSDQPMRDELDGQDLVSRVHEVEIPAATSDTISIILKFGNAFKERATRETSTETESFVRNLVTNDAEFTRRRGDSGNPKLENVDATLNYAKSIPLTPPDIKIEEARSIYGMFIPQIDNSDTELRHSPNHRSVSAYTGKTRAESASSVRSVDAVTQTKRFSEKKIFSPYNKRTVLPKLFDKPSIDKPKLGRKVDDDVRLVLPPLQYYYYGRLRTLEEHPGNAVDEGIPADRNVNTYLPEIRNKFALESLKVETRSSKDGEGQEEFIDVYKDPRKIDCERDRTSKDHHTTEDDNLSDYSHQQKERAIRNFARLVCDSEYRQGELHLTDRSTGSLDSSTHETNKLEFLQIGVDPLGVRKEKKIRNIGDAENNQTTTHNSSNRRSLGRTNGDFLKRSTNKAASGHRHSDNLRLNSEFIAQTDGEEEIVSGNIRWGREEPQITVDKDTEDSISGCTARETIDETDNNYDGKDATAAQETIDETDNKYDGKGATVRDHTQSESDEANNKEAGLRYDYESIDQENFYEVLEETVDTSDPRSYLEDTGLDAGRAVASAAVLKELKGAVAALGEQRAIMGGQLAATVVELRRTVRQLADREKMASPATTATPPVAAAAGPDKAEDPKSEAAKPSEETKKVEAPKEDKKEEPTKAETDDEVEKEEAPQAEGNTPEKKEEEKKDPDAKSPEPEENGEAPGTPKGTSLREQFKAFSKFGDIKSDGKQLTLSQSDKWMKQAKVIDGKTITTTDTAITFKKFKQMKIGYPDYEKYLQELAKYKNQDAKAIKDKMRGCGTPGTRGTTSVVKGGAFDRLTDTQKYTGSHKQRFDADGKGKGVAGRKDVPDKSGYVSGYKNKNTYSKTH